MKRDYRASLAVLALTGGVFILMVGYNAFGWAGAIGVAVIAGAIALAVRSSLTRPTETWYWDRTDTEISRPRHPRGGAR
ncbi:hypothetical protein [Nocardia sp. NPDC003963]